MPRAETATPTLTVVGEPLREIGGTELTQALRNALAWLQANQEEVNDLNVFPVPDGDTGSNMYLTLRSAVEAVHTAGDPDGAGAVLAAAAHGSLMGARGNSGVILSQIFRGFASGAEGQQVLTASAVAAGLRSAAAVAYKAVMKPTEGTILTVIRVAGEAATRAAEESDDIRHVLSVTVSDAHEAVRKTTEQLAVLRDAGVVDAGGYGLTVILEGLTRALGEAPDENMPRASGEPRLHTPHDGEHVSAARRGAAAVAAREEGWGYCTEFLIHGPGLDPEVLRNELSTLGESALVVGDAELVRVHIHTPDPASLITAASMRGRLSKLKVEDMTAQHHDVLERAGAAEALKPLGVVAVVPGAGLRAIVEDLGCDSTVEGGQTMNPSIEDLLTAVHAAGAREVLLLPNNGNVILTAQQVDALAGETSVTVVPTRNVPQGISALLAYNPSADAATNAEHMGAALSRVTAVEITRAVRDSTSNGLDIQQGEVIAIVDGAITEHGPDEATVIGAVLSARTPAPELVTVYRGAQVDEATASALIEKLLETHPSTEFELHDGGQDHYPYILSLE